MNTIYPMEYKPYQPTIRAEDMAGAHRAIADMVKLSSASHKANPNSYTKIVADYWKARQAAIASY